MKRYAISMGLTPRPQLVEADDTQEAIKKYIDGLGVVSIKIEAVNETETDYHLIELNFDEAK